MRTPMRALGFVLLVLLVSLSTPFAIRSAAAAQTTTVALSPTDDVYIDSGNSGSNYGSSSALATLSYCSGLLCLLGSRYMQTWLKFSLSSIPPSATIESATLTLMLSYARVPTLVGVYGETDSSWSENTITWSNAPMNSVSGSPTSTQYVANGTTSYSWSVTSLVAGGSVGSGPISFVLEPTSSQSSNSVGYAVYYSGRGGYSSFSPSLTVVYSYVSASVSLSSSTSVYGSSVTITGNTNPAQYQGTMTLLYSTDQSSWNVLISQSGGSATTGWTPPSAGNFYFESEWQVSWNNGANSYTATSAVSMLTVARASSSTQLALSPSAIVVGNYVTISVSISPSISDGTITLQYSTDQSTWYPLTSGTPSSGAFTYNWSPPNVGTYYVRASWSGDANYLGSTSALSTLTVEHTPTSISLSAPSTSNLGQTITITAVLRDNAGNPIPNAQISFQMDSAPIGTATTGTDGSATLVYGLTVDAGPHIITASYSGSSEYAPSSAQSTITVSPWKLVVSTTVPNTFLILFNSHDYQTDSSGHVVILVNSSGIYSLSIISPAVTSPGTRVVFVQWSDGTTSINKMVNVSSDVSLSVVLKTQFMLTISSSYGNPTGTGWYDSGSSAQFTVNSLVDQGNNTRRVFEGWTENGQSYSSQANGTIPMTGPVSLEAAWQKQYNLQVTSEYGKPKGEGWYDALFPVNVSVISPFVINNGTRYVLTGFTGTGSAPSSGNSTSISFHLNIPSTLVFTWKPQYLVTITKGGGTAAGAGWYSAGAVTHLDAISPSNVVLNSSRMIFVKWTGALNSTSSQAEVTVNDPVNITAVWVQQYYVGATTPMGRITGEGWYNKSSTATIGVSPTAFGFLVQQVFSGWAEGVPSNGGVSTFVVSGPVNLHATWRNDYTQLILLIAAVVVVGGAGGFYLVRRGKGPALGQEETSKVEPSQIEPASRTIVKPQPEPETGTSVYVASACPVCGAVNPVGAVFCGSCGADLQHQ